MAKPATVKIKLVSSADTGFFYVTKKNPRTQTEKLSFRKYDPVVRKHVDFKETKIKKAAGAAGRLHAFFPPGPAGSGTIAIFACRIVEHLVARRLVARRQQLFHRFRESHHRDRLRHVS